MSARARVAFVLLLVAVLGCAATVATARVHRLRVPPAPPLPAAATIDETEWSVSVSRRVLAAGEVTLRVYNRGMDDHDLVLVDSDGVVHRVDVGPGQTDVIRARLAPGRHRVFCSILAGTAESHEAQGMWAELVVRTDPARRGTASPPGRPVSR